MDGWMSRQNYIDRQVYRHIYRLPTNGLMDRLTTDGKIDREI